MRTRRVRRGVQEGGEEKGRKGLRERGEPGPPVPGPSRPSQAIQVAGSYYRLTTGGIIACMGQCPDAVKRLIERFEEQRDQVCSADYNETQLRIEELQGQLRFLDDRTSLATIRLNLREEGVEPAEVERASIPNAFERSLAGFVGVIAGVVVGLGYVIPLVGIGLLAWFVVSRVRRRPTA